MAPGLGSGGIIDKIATRRVSGRVVNSSHNTSVYTADTEPATFAPLPCSH